MLNPSTADGSVDDPTIRRCISFAKVWGFEALRVVNLFALRSTNPQALLTASDPVGPDNQVYLDKAFAECSLVVAAWGAHAAAKRRGDALIRQFPECRVLGKTKSGAPRHPLYLPKQLNPLRIEW